MRYRAALAVLTVALAALAGWPAFLAHEQVEASTEPSVDVRFTPAPVTADYLRREQYVAFYERAVARTPSDQIMARMLAAQYLMRFRECGDVGDLLRARLAAQRSLDIQPRLNPGAESALASVALALHKFRDAQRYDSDIVTMTPRSSAAVADLASTDMELGEYAAAAKLLARQPSPYADATWEATIARYDELTGDLRASRMHLERGMRQVDSVFDNPAEARAWYHFRAGELAFEDGDPAAAENDLKDALAIFPDDAKAYNALARVYSAEHRWSEALDAANRAAALVPLPETLGYKADAQRALGDRVGAHETDDLIAAVERIGNASGVNDRAVAMYESEHGEHLDDAVRIAQRDLAARDDIFAEDTIAWALAMDGRWASARAHSQKAVALGIEDSRVQFHAGMIDLKTGHVAEGAERLRRALAVNPHFHPVYADQARRELASLQSERPAIRSTGKY
ncbi:MAG TPA: tetratricopeptide repeat protein [Candidatus Eremiobacteraceae bacterium]|nr:tetratricopeptide repeat protein [Candidatus Eremiobacteraceae bacterium]